jgi:hypothetical protein
MRAVRGFEQAEKRTGPEAEKRTYRNMFLRLSK